MFLGIRIYFKMSKRTYSLHYTTLIPLVFSSALCISMVYFLDQKIDATPAFLELLQNLAPLLIGISGITAIVIFAYIVYRIFGIKAIEITSNSQLHVLVEKMNAARKIIEILFTSKIWLPGVKTFIDDEFEGLSFFDVKEFYKGKSKLAIEFLEEKKGYDETETLYLELKSLLYTEPKQKNLPKSIVYPSQYNPGILEKWLEHNTGSGLWYNFGYKFGDFKKALHLDALHERHQDKIMSLATIVDPISFEDSSFNDVFLSKFGEYINKNLIPKLYEAQSNKQSGLSRSLQLVYILFACLATIGVLLPLVSVLFQLPAIILICSFSFVISALFFIIISALPFLTRSADS